MLKINFARRIPNAPPHYNGAPSQDYLIALVDPDRDEFTLDLIRWGLIPHYSKDGKVKLINAVAETADTKAAFAESFAKRRCLVPIDGFFEWKKIGKRKQPYMIAMADRQPFTLAGLWRDWKDPKSGDLARTFTIITTEPNELLAKIHDRMPVVIAPEDRERWVKGPNPKELLKPFPADLMTMWPVSPDLNSPKNDRPDLLDPIEEPEGDGEPVKRADEGDADREPTNSD
ncbi:MAG: SOS response-associated peptidase [Pseudomonadota bacterium]|nr:SOS response-associated peptidase [Pseudomonadota bacterium]